MFGWLTCRNGHGWAPCPLGPDRCPRCGAATRSPFRTAPAVWVVLGLVEVNVLAATVCCFLYWDRLGALAPLTLAVALGGVAVWVVVQDGRARRMEAVCREMGFTFTGQLSPRRLAALGPFQAFSLGKWRTAYHLMEGHWNGCAVALLELRYTSATDGDNPASTRTVVIVSDQAPAAPPERDFARHFRPRRTAADAIQEEAVAEDGAAPRAPAPALSVAGLEFRLEPVGPGGWLWQRLGLHDAPFPEHRAFSESYRVNGPGGAVRRAFRPEVLDFFADNPGWHVEALGGRLLAHCKGPCDPADCPGLIAEVVKVYRVLMKAWSASAKG
jgi:hypothetical protein